MVSRKDDLSSVKKYPLVRRLNSAPKKWETEPELAERMLQTDYQPGRVAGQGRVLRGICIWGVKKEQRAQRSLRMNMSAFHPWIPSPPRKAEQKWLDSCKGQEPLLVSRGASTMGVRPRNTVSATEGWAGELEKPGPVDCQQREPRVGIRAWWLEGWGSGSKREGGNAHVRGWPGCTLPSGLFHASVGGVRGPGPSRKNTENQSTVVEGHYKSDVSFLRSFLFGWF